MSSCVTVSRGLNKTQYSCAINKIKIKHKSTVKQNCVWLWIRVLLSVLQNWTLQVKACVMVVSHTVCAACVKVVWHTVCTTCVKVVSHTVCTTCAHLVCAVGSLQDYLCTVWTEPAVLFLWQIDDCGYKGCKWLDLFPAPKHIRHHKMMMWGLYQQ